MSETIRKFKKLNMFYDAMEMVEPNLVQGHFNSIEKEQIDFKFPKDYKNRPCVLLHKEHYCSIFSLSQNYLPSTKCDGKCNHIWTDNSKYMYQVPETPYNIRYSLFFDRLPQQFLKYKFDLIDKDGLTVNHEKFLEFLHEIAKYKLKSEDNRQFSVIGYKQEKGVTYNYYLFLYHNYGNRYNLIPLAFKKIDGLVLDSKFNITPARRRNYFYKSDIIDCNRSSLAFNYFNVIQATSYETKRDLERRHNEFIAMGICPSMFAPACILNTQPSGLDGKQLSVESLINELEENSTKIIGRNTLRQFARLQAQLRGQLQSKDHINQHQYNKILHNINIIQRHEKRKLKELRKTVGQGHIRRDQKSSQHKDHLRNTINTEPSGFSDLGEPWSDTSSESSISSSLFEAMEHSDFPILTEILDSPQLCKMLLAAYAVFSNPTQQNLVIWLCAIALEFGITILQLIRLLKEIFKGISSKIYSMLDTLFFDTGSLQAQPNDGGIIHAQASGLTMDQETILNLSSITAGIAAIIACVIVGYKNFNDEKIGSWIKKLSSTGAHITKIKNGIYSVINIVKDFSTMIYDCVKSLLIREPAAALAHLLRTIPVRPEVQYITEDYFKKVEFYCNPENDPAVIKMGVQATNEIKDILEVGNHALYLNSTGDIKLCPAQIRLLERAVKEVTEVRNNMARNPDLGSFRKCPFNFYIAGEAGKGKSQKMPEIVNALIALMRMDDKENHNNTNYYQLPPDELLVTSINFADKFMSGYKGQFALMVDDIFQENGIIGDTSSTLEFIKMISCIPMKTNQADLKDKGFPFTTSLVVASSNSLMPHCNEIKCQDAVYRRRNVLVEMLDLDLFNIRDPLNNNILHDNVDFIKVMAYAFQKYKEHWALQLKLENSKEVSQADISKMYSLATSPSGLFSLEDNTPFARLANTSGFKRYYYMFLFLTLSYFTGFSMYVTHIISNLMMGQWPIEWMLLYYWRTGNIFDSQNFTPPWNFINKSIEKCFNYVERKLKYYALTKIWKSVKMIHVIAALLGTYLVYRVFSGNGKTTTIPSGISYSNQGLQGVRATRLIPSGADGSPDEAIFCQDLTLQQNYVNPSLDKQAQQLVHNTLIQKNGLVKIKHKYGSNGDYSQNAIRVKGRWILTNDHFFAWLKPEDTFQIEIKHSGGVMVVTQSYDPSKKKRIGSKDAALYECDNSMIQATDITSHFPTELKQKNYQCVLPIKVPSDSIVGGLVAKPAVEGQDIAYKIESDHSGNTLYYAVTYYEVKNFCQHGASGSPLVTIDPKNQSKIIGIQSCVHVESRRSFIEPIFRQELTEILDKQETIPLNLEEVYNNHGIVIAASPSGLGTTGMMHLGKLENGVTSARTSKIQKSIISDMLGTPPKIPSVLSNKDPRIEVEIPLYSLEYHRSKDYDRNYGYMHPQDLAAAVSAITNQYDVLEGDIERRLLTDSEAINGCGEHILKLDMTTSPGYPYITQRTTKQPGKYEWFTQKNGIYSLRPDVAKEYDIMERMIRAGERPSVVSYYCLKDETLKPQKIAEAKTRGFQCMPFTINLLIRKYFGAFIAMTRTHAGDIAPCVGVDPAKDWTRLFSKLASKSKEKCKDLDYKNWDASVPSALIQTYAEIANSWYADSYENQLARRVLISLHCFLPMIVKNHLYLTTGGVPSGSPLTADLNSVIHEVLLYYAYRRVKKNLYGDFPLMSYAKQLSYKHYQENVAAIVFGDDLCFTTKDDDFNGLNIQQVMNEIGLHVTSGTKDDNMDFCGIYNITFLKRKFADDTEYPQRKRAPLDTTSLMNMGHWVKKSHDAEQAIKDNMDTMLREACEWDCSKIKHPYNGSFYSHLLKIFERSNERFQTPYIPSVSDKREALSCLSYLK